MLPFMLALKDEIKKKTPDLLLQHNYQDNAKARLKDLLRAYVMIHD